MSTINYITTIFASVIECLVVIYYSNSIMNYKQSQFRSNLYIATGYLIYTLICLCGKPALNVLSGIVILFAVLYLGFTDSIGHILLTTIIIMLLSMFGEWVVALMINVDLDTSFSQSISDLEDIIFTLTSKLIMYISVVLLKHLSVKRYAKQNLRGILYFLVLPISTMFLLSCLGKVCSEISMPYTIGILISAIAIIISNFIVYIVYDKMLDNTEKINRLQELQYKEKLDYASYDLMKEKYDELKIMVHDFEKYCNNIEGMIHTDQNEASSFIAELKEKNKEFLLIEYTNNKALNVLLSQKQHQCSKSGIDFQVYIQDVDLSFIREADVVSIFSNLLDNAIEACVDAANKKIFLSVKQMNDAFVVIRTDNSCAKEPIIRGGVLQTQKSDKTHHGIGMLSIKKSIEKYNGAMEWSYDNDSKTFSTILMISSFVSDVN